MTAHLLPESPTLETLLENFGKAYWRMEEEQFNGDSGYRSSREALTQRFAELEAEIAELRKPAMCGVCAGTGKPTSGLPCVCGGAGTEMAEMHGLRVQCFEYEREIDGYLSRISLLEANALTPEEWKALHDAIGYGWPSGCDAAYQLRGKIVRAVRLLQPKEGESNV